ncbi:MAG: PD-(D/E)XK nuclease family protein, partial [Candidatus Omnitrophica bacterium]|nr:PD-(D/E)XK nuclease family protein [Candidatus Omnitrophota bacterium]
TASPQEDNIPTFYLSNAGIVKKKYTLKDEGKLLFESLDNDCEEKLSLAITADAVKSAVKEMVLTPTKVNNYLKCKRKFFYDDVLRLPGRKRPGLVFGSCCHKALEEIYKKFMATARFPDFTFFSSAFKQELSFQGADKSIERSCLDKLVTLKNWFENEKRSPVKPLGLEKRIVITLGEGVPFVGKYDKIEAEDKKTNLVCVIDYKTGKPDKYLKAVLNFSGKIERNDTHDYIRQLASYKILVERDKTSPQKYTVSRGALVFLEPVSENAPSYGLKKGVFKNAEVSITKDMTDELESTIKDVWAGVQQLSFDKLPERDEAKCGNCEFDNICWRN